MPPIRKLDFGPWGSVLQLDPSLLRLWPSDFSKGQNVVR